MSELLKMLEKMEPFIDEDFPRGFDNHGTCATDEYVAACRDYKKALGILRGPMADEKQAAEFAKKWQTIFINDDYGQIRDAFMESIGIIKQLAEQLAAARAENERLLMELKLAQAQAAMDAFEGL